MNILNSLKISGIV